MTNEKDAIETKINELMQQIPANHRKQLKAIIDLGTTVYTPGGFEEFLSPPLPDFEHKTAYNMLVAGNFDAVMSALASDYEGLGA